MQGSLAINPDELRAKGQALVSKSEQQQSELNAIHALAQPDGIWEGAASTEYQQTFERWTQATREMLDALGSMGRYLGSAADTYQKADEEIRAAVQLNNE